MSDFPDPPSSCTSLAITGWGLVSPLGHGAWDTFSQLLRGRTTADRLVNLLPDLGPGDVVRAVGGVHVARHGVDPAVELAERAVREALFMAQGPGVGQAWRTRWFMGSSKGAVHALHAAADEIRRDGQAGGEEPYRLGPPPPADAGLAIALGPHGYLSHHLERRLGVTGIGQVVAACASSLIALHQARQWLLHGDVEDGQDPSLPRRAVVLTSEAALLDLFIASYRRLGVLSPLTPDDDGRFHYRPRPLDNRRAGFVLAELGAAVVLETVVDPQPGQLLLEDTAHAAEGYDVIRPHTGMPALSHVAQKLLAGRAVDLIHAHATGTADHDPAELLAYARHLTTPADVYAVKGALGHGLGAAGLVSVVMACLCAKAHRRPPMPWLEEPLDSPCPNLILQADAPPPGPMRRQAVFAAGFGGHVAGAVIRQV